jgi:hypothetical protein
MPKRHQQRQARSQAGHNNPRKSTVITTGPYKKPETYRAQAIQHEDPGRIAQAAAPSPSTLPTPGHLTRKADSRRRMNDREKRSGSESNATTHRKDREVHEVKNSDQPQSKQPPVEENFTKDLHGNMFAGEHHGERGASEKVGPRAHEIKRLHKTLADLTDDELKQIVLVPQGQRLEQGAKYIDLAHLEQGEFTALANMIAEPDHYYVPKQENDYVLWNRLNQVDNPARLDEQSEQ